MANDFPPFGSAVIVKQSLYLWYMKGASGSTAFTLLTDCNGLKKCLFVRSLLSSFEVCVHITGVMK